MISLANLLCVLLTYLIESWISPGGSYEFNVVVYVQWEKYIVFVILQQHMECTLSRTNLRESIKIHFCLSFSLLYLFICNWIFFILKTGANDIAHDENAMSSLIIQSI